MNERVLVTNLQPRHPPILHIRLVAIAHVNGAPATHETFLHAADTVLRDARGFGHNDFKIELARRAILRALTQAARGTPQSQADKRIK